MYLHMLFQSLRTSCSIEYESIVVSCAKEHLLISSLLNIINEAIR